MSTAQFPPFISFTPQQRTTHVTVLTAPSSSAAFCFWQVMCFQLQLEAALLQDRLVGEEPLKDPQRCCAEEKADVPHVTHTWAPLLE